MKSPHLITVRYTPDPGRDEMMNVGVLVFDGNQYHGRMTESFERFRYLGGRLHDRILKSEMARLKEAINQQAIVGILAAPHPFLCFSVPNRISGGSVDYAALTEQLFNQLVHFVPQRSKPTERGNRPIEIGGKWLRKTYENLYGRPPRQSAWHKNVEIQGSAATKYLEPLKPIPESENQTISFVLPNCASVMLIEPLIRQRTQKDVFTVAERFDTIKRLQDEIGFRKEIVKVTVLFDDSEAGEAPSHRVSLARDLCGSRSDQVFDTQEKDDLKALTELFRHHTRHTDDSPLL